MNLLHRLLKPVALLLLLSWSLHDARALEVRLLSWSGTLDHLFLEQDRKPVPITVSERNLSPVHILATGKKLVLFRETVVDDKPARVTAGEFTPPPNLTRAILLLAVADAGGQSLVGTWIDDSEAAHPKGQIAFLNLAPVPVAIQADTSRYILPLHGTQLYPFPPDVPAINLRAAITQDGQPQLVVGCSLRVHPDYKILVLFREGRADPSSVNPDYIAHPVEFVTFYDYIPPPANGPTVAMHTTR